MYLSKSLLSLFIVLLFQNMNAQSEVKIEKRIYTTKALRGDEIPVIDGLLNDTCWNIVTWSNEFIEREPDENTTPSEQTKFKIIYDKNFLYIAGSFTRC